VERGSLRPARPTALGAWPNRTVDRSQQKRGADRKIAAGFIHVMVDDLYQSQLVSDSLQCGDIAVAV